MPKSTKYQDAANVSLPSLCSFQGTLRFRSAKAKQAIGEGRFLVAGQSCVNAMTEPVEAPHRLLNRLLSPDKLNSVVEFENAWLKLTGKHMSYALEA